MAKISRSLPKISWLKLAVIKNFRLALAQQIWALLRRGWHYLKTANGFYAHFAVEMLLLLILTATVGANLILRSNSDRAQTENRSLFFVYLKAHPALNEKLVDAWEAVNMKLSLAINPASALPSTQQILGASTGAGSTDPGAALPSLSGSTMLKPNPATNSNFSANRDTEIYKVQPGDTVVRIASAYGVSVDTILWENNLSATATLKPDQELKILPVSGIEHIVQPGETVFSIAKKYGADPGDILDYNNIEIADYIQPGDTLIIPNGIKPTPPSPARQAYLAGLQRNDYQQVNIPPTYQGTGDNPRFIWPEPDGRSLSQGYSSRHRAIDIPCRGCAVLAAADGIVELAGWEAGGYGYTILLNHGNGWQTRYEHASKLLVTAGQQVKQGQQIMISGNTGHSTGPHLHFEIRHDNDFLNPLSFVRP